MADRRNFSVRNGSQKFALAFNRDAAYKIELEWLGCSLHR
jgi:hypothetical protein